MQCQLSYIPSRLHSLGKDIFEEFYIGEELHYRCKPGQCSKPYQAISLYDISHNRNFNDRATYQKDDVLFDIDESTNVQFIVNKDISTSIIKSLSQNKTFEKKIVSDNNGSTLTANIKLIHSPLPCMYSHCAFEVSLDKTVITKGNYSNTLGKRNPKAYKNLRRDIRIELTSIIYSSIIDNDSEIEIITEL